MRVHDYNPAKMTAWDKAVTKVLRERARERYQNEAALRRSKMALVVAQAIAQSLANEKSPSEIASLAWDIYEAYSPGDASYAREVGYRAGDDIVTGERIIRSYARAKGVEEPAIDLDPHEVGRDMRVRGFVGRDPTAVLDAVYDAAHRVGRRALDRQNWSQVFAAYADRAGARERSQEAQEAAEQRRIEARRAEEAQAAEAAREADRERDVRSQTYEWRELSHDDRDQAQRRARRLEHGDAGSEREAPDHFLEAGGARGAALETDAEVARKLARLLSLAGMASAAREVRAGRFPSRAALMTLAEEAKGRTKNARIQSDIAQLAEALYPSESSREAEAARRGASALEVSDAEAALRADAVAIARDFVAKQARPYCGPVVVLDIAEGRAEPTEAVVSHAVLALTHAGYKTTATKMRDVLDGMQEAREKPDYDEQVEQHRISKRASLIELNPPKSAGKNPRKNPGFDIVLGDHGPLRYYLVGSTARNYHGPFEILASDVSGKWPKPVARVSLSKDDGMVYGVDDLEVDVKYQRRGIATQLYRYAIEEARQRGCKVMSDPDTRSNEADNLHESLRKKLKYERGEYDGREVDFYLNPKIGSYVHGLETVRANPKNLAGVSFKLNEFKDNSGFYVEARVAEIIGRITLRSYKKTFFVQDLWVRRDFQRRGIGVELFRLAAEHARKRGAVIVSDQNMRSADADALHRYLCKVLPHRKEKHDDGEGRLNDCDVYSNPIAPECEQAARAAEKSAGRKYGEGQCQVCENTQAVGAGGAIVFHGYERPGYGFTLGRCMGADHMPFPATDALEDYVRNLRSMIEHSEGVLASLPTRTSVTVSTPPTVCGGAPGSKVVEKAAVTALEWQAAVRQVESAARTKIRFCREDIPRAEKRIAEGRRLSGE